MGHDSAVHCMAMVDDKLFTGGRDEQLFVWKGMPQPNGEVELAQDCPPLHLGSSLHSIYYDAQSKWLFCGLWNGEIQAFCREPQAQCRMVPSGGPRRCVSSLTVHSGVLVSGSMDGCVRLWTMNPANGQFQAAGQPLTSPSGPVSSIKVLDGGLWVAGETGITVFDLSTLQAKGTLASSVPVTCLVDFQGHVVAGFRDGSLKIYSAAGQEAFARGPVGEHRSNTAMEIMVHPITQKPVLLCGQQHGYVTAYDLPDFTPRGSWCCRSSSDIRALADCRVNGMFFTGGVRGDIMMWQWAQPGAIGFGGKATNGSVVASNPFA